MADDVRSPAQYAAEIDAARDRLIAFAASCPPEHWQAAPLEGDPRPVSVIVDHVAHAYEAYEYMGGWVRRILAGDTTVAMPVYADGLQSAMKHHSPQWSRRGAWS